MDLFELVQSVEILHGGDFKLIRIDTTIDLSQWAEKRCMEVILKTGVEEIICYVCVSSSPAAWYLLKGLMTKCSQQ